MTVPGTERMLLFLILGILGCASSRQLPSSGPPQPATLTCPKNTSITCNVSFVAFVPCMNGSSVTRRCDSFVYPAILQAVQDVNSMTTITRNGRQEAFSINMNLIPIVTKNDPSEALYSFFTEHGLNGSGLIGIVGPRDNKVAERVTYIFGARLPSVTVSYGATDTLFNNRSRDYSHFYSTVPSERSVNHARLCLMRRLGWARMAVLASVADRGTEQGYARAASNLASLSKKYKLEFSLDYLGNLFMEAQPVFYKWQERQYKIIMLLLEPLGARQVLCQALQMDKMGSDLLLDDTHVWILPQYVSPHWWEVDEERLSHLPVTYKCNNLDILAVLNRINLLQVGSVKYNILGAESERDYHGDYRLTKSWMSLIDEVSQHVSMVGPIAENDLRQSLLATAYDAVWALALSTHSRRVQQTQHVDLTRDIQNLTFRGTAKDHDFESSELEDSSAMFLISQFRDGGLHPVWLVRDLPKNLSDCGSEGVFESLNGSVVLPGFNITDYSPVKWKGGQPSDGIENSVIPVGMFVLAVFFDVISFSLCIAMLIIMINFRHNKYIKSSSIKFLSVALISYMTIIPANVVYGLIYSAVEFKLNNEVRELLCLIQYPSIYVGWTITMAVLITKSWRIFKIFNNSMKRSKVSGIGDKYLVIYTVILVIPFFVQLLLWWLFSRPIPHTSKRKLTSGRDFNFSLCVGRDSQLDFWEYVSLTYSVFLLLLLSYLGFRNSRIKVQQFKEEGQSCSRSAATAVIFSVLFVMSFQLSKHPDTSLPFPIHILLFWYVTIYVTLSPVAIFGVLFIPKYVMIYRDFRIAKKEVLRRNTETLIATHMEELVTERNTLKRDIEMKKKKLECLRSRVNSRGSSMASLDFSMTSSL